MSYVHWFRLRGLLGNLCHQIRVRPTPGRRGIGLNVAKSLRRTQDPPHLGPQAQARSVEIRFQASHQDSQSFGRLSCAHALNITTIFAG